MGQVTDGCRVAGLGEAGDHRLGVYEEFVVAVAAAVPEGLRLLLRVIFRLTDGFRVAGAQPPAWPPSRIPQ
jgi:hypothetical protein